MAFTRQINDPCETKKRVEESASIFSYLMDSNKHYNCNPCFIERGVVGGNTASLYEGNMVDLESELSGRTRAATKCPSGQYLPGTIIQGQDVKQCGPDDGADGLPCGNSSVNKVKLLHLPTCSLVDYKPRPTDVGYTLDYPACGSYGKKHKKNKRSKARRQPYAVSEWQGQQGDELARY